MLFTSQHCLLHTFNDDVYFLLIFISLALLSSPQSHRIFSLLTDRKYSVTLMPVQPQSSEYHLIFYFLRKCRRSVGNRKIPLIYISYMKRTRVCFTYTSTMFSTFVSRSYHGVITELRCGAKCFNLSFFYFDFCFVLF